MTLLDLLLLSVSLAMDCFTVSIVCAAIMVSHKPTSSPSPWGWSLQLSFLFGLFQALMPVLGWLAMGTFASSVHDYGHWIALVLLLFVGGRMVWQSLTGTDQEQPTFNPSRLVTQLLLAVATSIDALAVGASLAVTGYEALAQLFLPVTIIGLGSLFLSLLGCWLGTRFGRLRFGRFSPELFGGIILIIIGLKVGLFA